MTTGAGERSNRATILAHIPPPQSDYQETILKHKDKTVDGDRRRAEFLK